MRKKNKNFNGFKQPPPELAKTPLQAWISSKLLSVREFAALLPETYSVKYLTYITNGRRRPSVRLAKEIEAATGGEVLATKMLRL